MQVIRFTILALFVGIGVGIVVFATPVYLTLRTNLDNCARQETREGCLQSKTAGCLWKNVSQVRSEPSSTVYKIDANFTNEFICLFPDYKSVDCSLFNNNSDSCQLFNDKKSCEYRFVSDKCVHRAGFDEFETGLFSACTVAGGAFGPYLIGKFHGKFGHFKTLLLLSFFSFLSALLFTIGIENGELGLWASSKVLSSLACMSGAALFPDIVKETSSPEIVKPHHRVMMMRSLGMCIGVAALLSALFLYVDTPRGQFVENPVFNVRLQNFNIVQWLISLGYVVFALSVKYAEWFDENICWCELCHLHHHDQHNEEHEMKSNAAASQKDKIDDDPNPPSSTTASNHEPDSSSSVLESHRSGDHHDFEERRNFDDVNAEEENQNSPPEIPTSSIQKSQEEDEDEIQRKIHLQWLAAILSSCAQQLVGVGAVASYTPIILQDLTSDPILAQLCFAAGLPVGAILSATIITHFIPPYKIFIVTCFICSISTFVIGLALMPGLIGDSDDDSSKSSSLALFGLILFAISFGAGPSSMFLATLMDTFKVPSTLHDGMTFGTSFSLTIQLLLRLVFPIFVANIYSSDVRVGRGIAFFSFAVLGFVSTAALTVVRIFL